MSEQPGTTPPKPAGPPPSHPPARSVQDIPVRLIVFGALLVYGVLWVILNSEQIDVSFVFFSATTSLALVIVLALLLGFFGGFLFDELRARRSRRQAGKAAGR